MTLHFSCADFCRSVVESAPSQPQEFTPDGAMKCDSSRRLQEGDANRVFLLEVGVPAPQHHLVRLFNTGGRKMPREKCECGCGVKHVSASRNGPSIETLH